MSKSLIRVLVVAVLMAGIVMFWVKLDWFVTDPGTRFYLVAGGASLFGFGVLYKLLGSWDVIPDWIPILGSLDDMVAWLLMLAGLGAGAVGWFLF